MSRLEVIELMREFYQFLLSNYAGEFMHNALPVAIEEFGRLEALKEVHAGLDQSKCLAQAVVDKYE